jgi:superfamily II DNA or RNA helicase
MLAGLLTPESRDFCMLLAESVLNFDLKYSYGKVIYSRGQDYYTHHKVSQVTIENLDKFIIFTGQVKGSIANRYTTKVRFELVKGKVFQTESSCSCPMEGGCKHVVATIMQGKEALRKQLHQAPQFMPRRISDGELVGISSGTGGGTPVSQVPPPSSPPSSPPSFPQPPMTSSQQIADLKKSLMDKKNSVRPEVRIWLNSFLTDGFSEKLVQEKKKVFRYMLDPKARKRLFSTLAIKPIRVGVNKNGTLSKAKPEEFLRPYSLEMHLLPADQVSLVHELVSIADPHFYGGYVDIVKLDTDSRDLFTRLFQTGLCCLGEYENVLSMGEDLSITFDWEMLIDGNLQVMIPELFGKRLDLFRTNPLIYIDHEKKTIGFATTQLPHKLALQLMDAPAFNLEEMQEATQVLNQIVPNSIKLLDTTTARVIDTITPVGRVWVDYKKEQDYFFESRFTFQVWFDYDGIPIPAATEGAIANVLRDGKFVKIVRDKKTEATLLKPLTKVNWQSISSNTDTTSYTITLDGDGGEAGYTVHEGIISPLQELGWIVTFCEGFPFQVETGIEDWYNLMDSEEGNYDWFDFEAGVKINGQDVNLVPTLVHLFKTNNVDEFLTQEYTEDDVSYVRLPNQKYLPMPSLFLANLARNLLDIFQNSPLTDDNRLRVDRWRLVDAASIAAMTKATEQRWIGSDHLRSMAQQLLKPDLMTDVPVPETLQADLRGYQKEGLNWLQFMSHNYFGGILADDMGLGKTIQTISHILKEKEAGRAKGPILIIAPTSLMGNWESELTKFSPSLSYLTLQGPDRKKYYQDIDQKDVILTTYPLVIRDSEELFKHQFHLLILDEAQMIKNPLTKYYVAIQQLKATHRLCLTGTPMENHLGELWSIFNFLMPGFLGSQRAFAQHFRRPIEKLGDDHARTTLTRRITPFILRRTKAAVAHDLPAKTEIIQTIDMENDQRAVYESIRIAMNEKVQNEISKKGLNRSQIIILDALLKLRQACCDPRLLKMGESAKKASSAKLTFLRETLPSMIEEGRQILIFSQFAEMIALLQQELEALGIPYSTITGQTQDRRTPVDQFQSGKTKVFLITLKAGGTGLNLTAADTVIHVDPWWNPAVENQATDRAYRIGQAKPVFVYKLIAAGSIEEKILELQKRKAQMTAGVLDGDKADFQKLSADDIQDLFAVIR